MFKVTVIIRAGDVPLYTTHVDNMDMGLGVFAGTYYDSEGNPITDDVYIKIERDLSFPFKPVDNKDK